MKVLHSWLKDYYGEDLPSADVVADRLTFHAFEIDEVEKLENGDAVIDVDVLPNRSSDCLCHRGVARELGTILNKKLENDPLLNQPDLPVTDQIKVEIESPKACPRFTASIITGIKVGDSPAWLKERLEALGQRSINNIVDATNYVMLAIGQPLHAYDADLFSQSDGAWRFLVRSAKPGETVSLLAEGGKDEDRVVELKGTETLIVDASSNTPIGLAGVKGGRYAGVHAGTTKIIVEAAHFDPTLTRQTARGLGIVIDASKRFENEPARELPLYAQSEIVDLIIKIAGGECEGVVDTYLEKKDNPAVEVRFKKVNDLLGLDLDKQEIISLVERLGGSIKETRDDSFVAVAPFERTDLNIEEDYIEEVGRIYGLDRVEAVKPSSMVVSEFNARHYYSEKIRDALITLGFSEVITSSFQKKDQIQLQNALASDKSYLRSGLAKNLREVLQQNISHTDLLGLDEVKVFEIGTIFKKGEGSVNEQVSLALGVQSKAAGYTQKDDPKLNEAIEVINQTLGIEVDFVIDKGIAECDFSKVLEKLPAPTVYDTVEKTTDVQYRPFSIYPAVSRDIALWVGADVVASEVEKILNDHAGELRVRTTLFDEFIKDGRTSYAFRLVFQSKEKTLTDEEVNKIMDDIYNAAKAQGWEVR